MWQSPPILLQQAISACVIEASGKQAKTGIAVHAKTRTKAMMERPFTMNRCYIPHPLGARTQLPQMVVPVVKGHRCGNQRTQNSVQAIDAETEAGVTMK